jgi:hypothetical protein
MVSGILKWGEKASAGTMLGREKPINLSGQYRLQWSDFSKLDNMKFGTFRYLEIVVSKPSH